MEVFEIIRPSSLRNIPYATYVYDRPVKRSEVPRSSPFLGPTSVARSTTVDKSINPQASNARQRIPKDSQLLPEHQEQSVEPARHSPSCCHKKV